MLDKIKITGLWKEKDKYGNTVLKAKLGMFYVCVYPNTFKKKDNEPDYNLCFTQKQYSAHEEGEDDL